MSTSNEDREQQQQQHEDDDEDLMQFDAPYYKDTVLWLIDNHASMHEIDPESGKSYLHRAIEVATRMMEHKLIRSPSDKVGIVLFNTKQTRIPDCGKKMTHPGCYAIAPIAQVGVPAVMELRDDLADADRHESGPAEWFKERYPPYVGQVKIHYALINAESMLNSAGKTGSRRIFFVTNVDDPYAGRSVKNKIQLQSLEKIKEMRRRGIEFEAFFINRPDKKFDTSAFYADLFQAYEDEADYLRSEVGLGGGNDVSTNQRVPWSAFDKFEELEKDVSARETPKRVVFRIGMELAPGFTIGIAGYNVVNRASNNTGSANRGHPVNVYRADEDDVWQEVTTTSHHQCKETGQILTKDQIYHAFSLGYDTSSRGTVRFTPDEINKLKTSGLKPGLKVLGFKDQQELRFWENVKHSYFIFPTDAEWVGSQRAFSAMLHSMVKKDKMGIGLFMARPTSIPEFVAILPQAEELNDEGVQTEPPGMHLIMLPFADDIRNMPAACASTFEATDEQVEKAARVVTKYTRNEAFNPDFYPNPALNYHFEALKAVAFGVDIDLPVDKTLPDYDKIELRDGRFIADLNASIASDTRLDAPPPTTTNANGDVVTSDKKKPIVIDRHEEAKLVDLHAKGNLASMKVDYLKAACEHYRLPKSGNKGDLIAKLEVSLDKVLAKRQATQA